MKKNKKTKIYKYGELYCGPGGLALGAVNSSLERKDFIYKIRHTWANDIDHDSCETYRNNIAEDSPESVICEDVRVLDLGSLSPVDIFAYGFPCNDFSIVGEQKGFDGEYGPLYYYGVKILENQSPLAFVAENVGGIKSANNGNAFKKILHDLSSAGKGYKLTANLYKAEEYGIPQTRHRMIIVGIRSDLNTKFRVPGPTNKKNYVSVKEALEEPPISEETPNHVFTNHPQKTIDRLKHIKPGENAWTADLPEKFQLNVKSAKMSQIYRRLEADKPSYTITGSGGGGTHGYHYSEPRALTNRERARIQTFPDSFVFEGGKGSVRKQIGMAVPPKLSEIIFTYLLKTLAGIEYEYEEPNGIDLQLKILKEEHDY